MQAEKIMSRDLFTLFEDDNVQIAKSFMDWKHFRHIPIVNNNFDLVGLLTHRDILRASISELESNHFKKNETLMLQTSIRSIMNRNVAFIYTDDSIAYAASLMTKNKFGCLPVLDRANDKLVGIITEADFVKYVHDKLLS